MSKEEPIEKPPLIDFKLESEWGRFFIREEEGGLITIEVHGKDGERFVINSLLPEGWRILAYASLEGNTGTRVEHTLKELIISESEARNEGWQYLLSVLHEVGHAIIYES